MDPTLISLISGFISGAITAVITYFATRSKTVLDLTIENDRELRKERLKAYQELWPRLKSIAKYSAERPLTWQIIKETSEHMRDWYFGAGGIYLSARSRKPYFDLKKEMQLIIDDHGNKHKKETELDPAYTTQLHRHATDLRASLSDDVGTRRKPFI
jgi:hypothetical protein